MSSAPLLVVTGRDLLLLVPGDREPRKVRLSPGGAHEGAELASALLALSRGETPGRGLGNAASLLGPLREGPVRVGDRAARTLAESLGLRVVEAPSREVAALREALPPSSWEPDRELLLSLAEQALAERLASPEEVIITLSREGDRLERLLRKEREALRALTAAAGVDTPVADYASRSDEHVGALESRRRELDRALEETVLRTLPNTSAVLGARTAARLLSFAGSVTILLRLDASRVQVLGARRRRVGSPGPRHGVLYGAEGMDRIPPSRRGALARSLASWAVVAIRADLMTQGSVGAALAERREMRIVSLSRGRRVRRPEAGPARERAPRSGRGAEEGPVQRRERPPGPGREARDRDDHGGGPPQRPSRSGWHHRRRR